MGLKEGTDGTQRIPLELREQVFTERCRPSCDQSCDAIRASLLDMLGHTPDTGALGNHQLQHILRSRTLRMLEPFHVGLRSLPCERNCCGGDGILVLPGHNGSKTIVLADINGHGAKEQPPLHDLFSIIEKAAKDNPSLSEMLRKTNMAFAAWRETLEDADATHIPYAECAFVRLQSDGELEAAVAGAITALILQENGSIHELCNGESHTTWIGFPLPKRPVEPSKTMLRAKQTLVLCTDGINPDIRNAHDFWRTHGRTNPDALANEIHRHFGSSSDDSTALCLRR